MFIPPVGLAAGALFFKQEGQKERGNKTVRETFPKQKPLARTRSKSARERKTPDTESRAGGVGRGTFAVVRVVHRFIFRATRKEIIVATTLQSVFRRRKHVRQLRRGGGGVRGVVVAVGTEFRAGHDRRAGGVRDVREGHYSASLLSVGAFERNAMCVDKAKSVSLVLFFSRFFPFFFFFFSFFSFPQHEKKKNKRKKKRVGAQIVLFCVRRLLFVMSLLRAFAMLPVLLLALVDENEAAMKRLPGFTYRANEEEGEKMNGATTPTKHAPLEGQTFIEGCRELCEEDESPPICVKNVSYANECWFMCRNNEALEGIELTRGACAEGALFAIAKRACAQACDLKFEPVCGETGETFSNECIAKCAKVRYTTNGSC